MKLTASLGIFTHEETACCQNVLAILNKLANETGEPSNAAIGNRSVIVKK